MQYRAHVSLAHGAADVCLLSLIHCRFVCALTNLRYKTQTSRAPGGVSYNGAMAPDVASEISAHTVEYTSAFFYFTAPSSRELDIAVSV